MVYQEDGNTYPKDEWYASDGICKFTHEDDVVYYNITSGYGLEEKLDLETVTIYAQLEEGNEMTYWEPSIN
jgi:hypothetical protein